MKTHNLSSIIYTTDTYFFQHRIYLIYFKDLKNHYVVYMYNLLLCLNIMNENDKNVNKQGCF